MSVKKVPITRTRQEVKNIDSGGGGGDDYITKEEQYAYGINTFTTENEYLKDVEIVSKDKSTTEKASIPKNYWYGDYDKKSTLCTNRLKFNISSTTTFTLFGVYEDKSYGLMSLECSPKNSPSIWDSCYANFNTNVDWIDINNMYTKWVKLVKYDTNHDYILSLYWFNNYFKLYNHTLTISKGNEFEGLVIKFSCIPTMKYNGSIAPTPITTPDLFITNINYIKDVVGFIIKEGIVTPYVFTYKDSTLYLNGSEIDVNSLTISDEVVTL